MRNRFTAPVFTLALTASALLPATAQASDPSSPTTPHMERLVNEGEAFVQSVLMGPTGRSTHRTKEDAEDDLVLKPAGEATTTPFIERMPRASLVLRDWRATQRIAGPSLVVDDIRPNTSNRIGLLRVATDAKFSIYGQVGAGELRIDPILCWGLRGTTAFAAQVGGGFSWNIAKHVDLGAELTYVVLRRESEDDPAPPKDGMVQALAAFRATF